MLTLSVHPTAEHAALAAAAHLAELIAEAQDVRGVAHVSLAGGKTPRRAYELVAPLLADPGQIDWWFGDERCVPPDDPDSNYRLVRESLFRGSPLEAGRLHRIAGEQPPLLAAAAYEAELRRTVPVNGHGIPSLDVALLGLGEDGHTASLFPRDPVLLAAGGELCVPVRGPKPPPDRITLTLEMLRAAKHVLILATGSAKRAAVAAALAGPDTAVPASLLADTAGFLIVDEDAVP
jgi:6-phosphogluconolactonase